MTGPLGNSEFCFPRISMFPSTSSRETLTFEGNKIYSKTKQTQNLKTALRFQRSRATAVIVFAMLPAHGIWRETVSLLDVM